MDCKKYLQEKGNVLEGIEAQPRLFLKEKDQPFFHKYIQNIQLDALGQLDPGGVGHRGKAAYPEKLRCASQEFC